jgi:hypothetical protein
LIAEAMSFCLSPSQCQVLANPVFVRKLFARPHVDDAAFVHDATTGRNMLHTALSCSTNSTPIAVSAAIFVSVSPMRLTIDG